MEIISKTSIMDTTFPIITFIVIFITLIPFSYLEMKIKEVPSGRYTYEVKIKDNSVSAKKILEKYDIIGFKDGIYKIEDKYE